MPKKPPATDKATSPANLAKVVGKICETLESLSDEDRRKVLDTVSKLVFATSTSPSVVGNKPPKTPSDLLDIIRPGVQFAPRSAPIR